jgi:transposase
LGRLAPILGTAAPPSGTPVRTLPATAAAAQATSDAELVRLWLARHRNSPRTVRAYRADVAAFLRHAAKPLRAITLADVQDFDAALAETTSTKGAGPLAPASWARRLSAVKSLLGFAHRLGYLAFDVGAPLKLPAVKQTLAERFLAEEAVIRLRNVADTTMTVLLLGAVAPPRRLIADKAYDADSLRDWLRVRRIRAVIPSTAARTTPYPLDRAAYRRRNHIERLFCRLKNWRHIATRYDRLATNYLAAVTLAALVTEWAK